MQQRNESVCKGLPDANADLNVKSGFNGFS